MDTLILVGQFIVSHAPELAGVILPPIIEVINKDVTKDWEKFLVALTVCFLTAIALSWQQLAYGSPEAVVTSFGLIFAESQVVFNLYFKNSFIRDKINNVTNPTPDLTVNPEKLPTTTPPQGI